VVVIDEQVYGQITPERAVGLVEDIRAAETLLEKRPLQLLAALSGGEP